MLRFKRYIMKLYAARVYLLVDRVFIYRKISNVRRAKYQNLNDSRLVLQLSLPSPLRPGVKSRINM